MRDPVLEGTPCESGHRLPAPTVRMGKLGPKLYLELDYLIADDRAVGQADVIRRELMDSLHEPGRLTWINVELHTDPDWDKV